MSTGQEDLPTGKTGRLARAFIENLTNTQQGSFSDTALSDLALAVEVEDASAAYVGMVSVCAQLCRLMDEGHLFYSLWAE